MKILALDTATPLASIAATEDGRLLGEIALVAARGHSENLLGALRYLHSRLGWGKNEPDLFIATAGPGSFTGLRIGIGTVRGLALAAGRPAAGVSTLAAMAAGLGAPRIRLAPVLDAGRGEVYAGLYSGEDPPRLLAREIVIKPRQLMFVLGDEPTLAFGSGVQRYRSELEDALGKGTRLLFWEAPLAAPAARLAGRLLEEGASFSDLPLSARYIRRSDARLPIDYDQRGA